MQDWQYKTFNMFNHCYDYIWGFLKFGFALLEFVGRGSEIQLQVP